MNYRELNAEELSKIVAPRPEVKGAKFVKYIAVPPSAIYIRQDEKGGNNNLVRNKMDYAVCNAIAASYRENGQLLHLPVPVVKQTKPFVYQGTMYDIVGVDIHHRKIASEEAGLKELICAVYEFENEQAEVKFQLQCNDQAPNNPVSADDICNTLCVAVSKGWINNNEEAMKDFVSGIKHCHPNTRNKGIREAMRLCGTYVDFRTWTANEINAFVSNKENYDNGEPQYVVGGSIDEKRNAVGWSVKEGYEYEYIMNAAKALVKYKKPSYFVCHTKTPTDKSSVDEKRQKMVSEFKALERALDEVFDYKNKNGSYPWSIESFLPQCNNTDGHTFVR